MRNVRFNANPEPFEPMPDFEFKVSDDFKTGRPVKRVPLNFPPTRTFEVENLMRSGIPLEPTGTFITTSIDDNMDKIDEINSLIEDNELI